MDFYETQAGHRYYGHTLPQIANALKKIADSLSAPVPCIHMDQKVPEHFLTELYLGNYDPSSGPDSEESIQCSAEIKAAQETIRAQIPPEVWEKIDHIFSLISQRSNIDRADAYAAGFRAATTMLAAGLFRP